MTNQYKQLVDKLVIFKKKFYLFQLLRGLLFFLFLFVFYFSIISLFEYFNYSSVFVRTFLFFFSLVLFVATAVWLLVIPLFKLIGLLNSISFKKISEIISEHFSEIEDKLLNILELAEENNDNNVLVWASIDNKIEKIKLFNFSNVFNYKKLKIGFLVLILSFTAAASLNIFVPDLFKESTHRIVNFNDVFLKPAPFTFQLINNDLSFKKGESVNLQVSCVGTEVPDILYVNIGGTDYLMSADGNIFSYKIDQLYNDISFYFTDLVYSSEKYELNILPNPSILNYTVNITPPVYTGFEEEKLNNIGDLQVPYGTDIRWNFNVVDADTLKVVFGENEQVGEKQDEEFVINHQAKKNEFYSVSLKNDFFEVNDLLKFQIEVIPDLYPEIQVTQIRDSLNYSRFYFKGVISDDYGFSGLRFNINVNQNDTIRNLQILNNLKEQEFYFTFDFNDIRNLGDYITYYFTVSDNDYFHNYKQTTSEVFEFNFPSYEEVVSADNQMFNELQDMVSESSKISEELQESIDELKYRSISENMSDWEKQQLMNEVLNKKNQLEDVLNQIQQKNSEMNNMMNSFTEEKADILEKQQQVEDLLNEVMTDEIKELFEEFNKLAQEFDQSQFNDMMENSDMTLDDLSQQLERNLQMLKQLKVEQKIENAAQMMEETIQKERENLSELANEKEYEEIQNKEEDNRDMMNSIQEEMNSANELNQSLEDPMDLFSVDQEFNDIQEKYNEIMENLDNKRSNKSQESMSENIEMMENLNFSLNQMLENNRQQQNAENIQNLRQILDNLIFLSLNQEDILVNSSEINTNDPLFNTVINLQHQISEQSAVIKDSLYALANRTPQISSKVNSELLKLEYSLGKSTEELENGYISSAMVYQQNSITSINEMALFLNESLENLQQQMTQGEAGENSSQQSGQKGQMGMSKLKEAQQSLKDQLQQMIEQMKNGNGQNMSQQMGKTLIQQEMLQQMMNELLMGDEIGSSAKEQLKQAEMLNEQNRIDLLNKNITTEMIERQNLILDKLLDAENAEMERDVEKERESKTADDEFYSNPAEFFEYKQKDIENIENIEYNNYRLRNYYDQKYRNYINQLKN